MQRKSLMFLTFAVVLSLVPPAVNAWPISRLLHLHPTEATGKDPRISFQLINRSGIIQELEVGSHKFTLMPNSGLTVNAPEGTQVISQTVGLGHKKGDVLVAVQRSMQYDTVIIH
jgi:hypothetical protein